jgi:hypothetical protein
MTSLFFPSISPEAGEPNNEVIPSKEFKYQLKSQILSGIKNEREICYTHKLAVLFSTERTLKIKLPYPPGFLMIANPTVSPRCVLLSYHPIVREHCLFSSLLQTIYPWQAG